MISNRQPRASICMQSCQWLRQNTEYLSIYDQDLEEEVGLDTFTFTFNIQQEVELDAALEIEDQIAGEMSVDTPDNGIGTK